MRLEVKVTVSELRIRKGPSTSYSWSGFLRSGEVVTVIKEQNSFYYLSDARGWIGKNYTTLVRNLEDNKPEKTDPKKTNPTPKTGTGGNAALNEKAKNDGNLDYEQAKAKLGSKAADELYVEQRNINKKSTPASDITNLVTTKFTPSTTVYRYKVDTSFVNQNLDIIRNNLNIVPSGDYASATDALFDRFNRYKIAFPETYLSKSFAHVFFTRPDLNLVEKKANGNYQLNSQASIDPLFYSVFRKNPKIIMSLSNGLTSKHDFQPFLSNVAESFELSDEFIKTVEHGETLTGYKVQYGKNNIESNTAGTFSINYSDDNSLSIYHTHKVWMEYISKVYRGEIEPKRDYITKKILDYACSAYYFLCGPDGETIIFWAKFFGVFPTSTPSSSLSWSKGSNVKVPQFNINYAYAWKEDALPVTLAEFNMNSKTDLIYKRLYEKDILSSGRSLSGAPFIDTIAGGPNRYTFKLRFRKY